MATRKKSSGSVADTIIDFTKEEQGGGGGVHIKEGTYKVHIIKAVPTVSTEKGSEGLELTLQIVEGKLRGKKLKDTLWVSPKAFSRFRTLLEACGKKVPTRIKLSVIAKAVKGSEIYVEVQDEEREGYRVRSRVTFDGFIHPDSMEDEEDDDTLDEEEDEEDLDEEEEEDDKEDEDDDLEEEDDEDEEEEEPEPPKRKSRGAAKTKRSSKESRSRRKTKSKSKPDDDEDLEDLDLDEL